MSNITEYLNQYKTHIAFQSGGDRVTPNRLHEVIVDYDPITDGTAYKHTFGGGAEFVYDKNESKKTTLKKKGTNKKSNKKKSRVNCK